MMAPAWRGVERIVVACEAAGDLADRLCVLAVIDARRDAALPVVSIADVPVAQRQDAIVRLQLERGEGDGAMLLVSMQRGVVVDDAEGARGDALAIRPIAVPVLDDAGLAAGVASAVNAVLPWRRQQFQGPGHVGSVRSRRP